MKERELRERTVLPVAVIAALVRPGAPTAQVIQAISVVIRAFQAPRLMGDDHENTR